MKHKCVFVGVRQVFPVGIKVRRIMGWTNAAILQRVANPFQGSGRAGGMKATLAGGRGTIGYSFKNVDAVDRLNPRIFPAVVSATVAASDAVTVARPHGTSARFLLRGQRQHVFGCQARTG